jgi:uncharacterized DUF497 family protein
MELEFEWHDAKAEANFEAHGVSFDLAKTVFKDAFAVERLDDRGAVCGLRRTRGAHSYHFGPEGNAA